MVEKSLCSLQSMGQMQNAFIRVGSLRSLLDLDSDREAVALQEGTGRITTGIEITGGEAEVGVGIGIVAGKGIIAIEAGAAA